MERRTSIGVLAEGLGAAPLLVRAGDARGLAPDTLGAPVIPRLQLSARFG